MVYLTGDTHGNISRFSSYNFSKGKHLSKNDFVIVLGDCGLLWSGDEQEKYWIKWLSEKPWTTLFIDGNHENFDMMDKLPTRGMFDNEVGVLADSIYHLKRGKVYTIAGNTFFTLGGAASIDRMYRVEGRSWWKQEQPNSEEIDAAWNILEKINYDVDYILTHTCPSSVKSKLMTYKVDFYDPLEDHLEDLMLVTSFKHWYFGHFHMNKTIDKFTCLYEDILELGKTSNTRQPFK